MNKIKTALLTVCCIIAVNCSAQRVIETSMEQNPESCAKKCMCGERTTPAGINTDHLHDKGEWMFSYSFMNMATKGARMGANTVSDQQVYQYYMMAPADMYMQMHMLMAMYGVTDKLTLMGMTSIVSNYMNMNMGSGQSMPGMVMTGNMESSLFGLGDSRITALYSLYRQDNKQLTGGMGIGLPTGSVTATGTTMLGDNQRMQYNMQPGSGSFSLSPTVAYTNSIARIDYGIEAGAEVKLNYNSQGYKTGNVYHANAWAATKLCSFLTGSLRAEGIETGKISGVDPMVALPINVSSDPSADTRNTGVMVMNLYAGLNIHLSKGVLDKLVFPLEYGIPFYQNLNGTQAAYHNYIIAGVAYRL